MVQRREPDAAELADLLSASDDHWLALAPHLGQPLAISLDDLAVLDALAADESVERSALSARFGAARVDWLVGRGLLIGDHEAHRELRAREAVLRDTAWWPPAAVAHAFGRWQGVDVGTSAQQRSLEAMIAASGLPPTASPEQRPAADRIALPAPHRTALDDLLAQRTTCRNFDPDFRLPLPELAAVLHRVFGAQATQELGHDVVALKKNSPSGGGLHPIEAYLLVQRVDGLAPGLYHYLASQHALEPLRPVAAAELAPLALELVAGQAWFANAPVLVLMAARFQRNFWKYRGHAKAWRVIQLDAGHLSQNLYLAATELGHGAFVTAALNDECAERLFEFDGLGTGAIAACGFGRRAASTVTTEFDPLGQAVR
jgi:putative peptide maturation dehydrogenase